MGPVGLILFSYGKMMIDKILPETKFKDKHLIYFEDFVGRRQDNFGHSFDEDIQFKIRTVMRIKEDIKENLRRMLFDNERKFETKKVG